MPPPLRGLRVVELAMWSFVPSAGAVLAEWGAEVLKIEPPESGDKLRGLVVSGVGQSDDGLAFMFEINNRGKRSLGIDVRHRQGRELVLRLAENSDVFLTSFLPELRRRLGLDAVDLHARNPRLVYAIGSGAGQHGPDADRGGYDLASYWARSGVANALTSGDDRYPPNMPAAGFGDVSTGLALAGAIAAALVGRERNNEGAVVDVSLFGNGLWAEQTEITATNLLGTDRFFRRDRDEMSNPLNAAYRTSDGRHVQLVMLEADRYWPELCERLGRPELAGDPRFESMAARRENVAACMAELSAVFATASLEHWRRMLDGAAGVWAVVQRARETAADAQALANGYVRSARAGGGQEYVAVSSPARFDGDDPGHRPAPAHGADTDDVLREVLGIGDEELVELKVSGAVL